MKRTTISGVLVPNPPIPDSISNPGIAACFASLEADNGVVIEHLIQTDAAIDPGNSHGPLLDSASRLIGIDAAIYS